MKIINNLYVRTHVGSMDACMHASIDDENLREKKWKGGEKKRFLIWFGDWYSRDCRLNDMKSITLP